MAGVDLNLSGAVRRTNKGSVDFYFGGGDEAWANLAAAYAGIPSIIRNGKVFGVITAGVISEYWWNDASQLADGDEIPYAQGGTTLTPDQVDAIDNANSPNSGNPFATMADILAGVVYQGVWNATTNTPTLTSSVGTQGHYYVVSVAGTTNLNGITDWEIGDWAIFNGAVWQKVDNTDVTGGNANITSINVAALKALQTGSTLSTTTFYNVTNAVGSTRVLQVYAIANNTNVVWAVDVTTGEIGTYNITGDVFTSPPRAATFKKTFTSAEIIATIDYSVAECPAVAGHYWRATSVDGKKTGTVGYDGDPYLVIKTDTAQDPQFTDPSLLLTTAAGFGSLIKGDITSFVRQFVENKGLKITVAFDGTNTVGDGDLTVYGTAELVKI